MSHLPDWPERDADLLHHDVTRNELIAIGCIVPRPRLRAAIECGSTISHHPDAPWRRADSKGNG